MAQYYQVRVGNDYIEVPDWVTLEVFQNLIDIESGSNSTLKNIEKVLRLILSKDSDIKEVNEEIKKSNKEVINNLQKSNQGDKNLKDVIDNNLKDLTGVSKKTYSKIDSQIKENKRNTEVLSYRQRLMFERLETGLSRSFQSIYEGNMRDFGQGIQDALGGIPLVGGLLGGVSGMLFGIFEEYVNTVTSMSDVGASFSMTLVDMKEYASDAGMGLDEFAKLVSENSSVLRVLGKNATEGARAFSQLSNRVLEGAERFNFYGMANQEINELLMEELELRRKSGQSLEYLMGNQDKVANKFNELISETSALADITGQSRREMLISRSEALSDVNLSAFRGTLNETQQEAFDIPATVLSGIIGPEFAQNMMTAVASGLPIERFMGPTLGVGGEFGEGLREMSEFFSENVRNMDPDILRDSMIQMARELEDTMSDEMLESVRTLSAAGNEQATAILGIFQNIQGLSETLSEDTIKQMRERERAIQDLDELGIPAQLEQTSRAIQLSIVRQFEGILPEDTGGAITETLRQLESDFGDDEATFMQGIGKIMESVGDADIFLLSDIANTLNLILDQVRKITGFLGISILKSAKDSWGDYKERGFEIDSAAGLLAIEGILEVGERGYEFLSGDSADAPDISGSFRDWALGKDSNQDNDNRGSSERRNRRNNDSLITGQGSDSNVDGGIRKDKLLSTNYNDQIKETNRILEELIRETRKTREAIENQ